MIGFQCASTKPPLVFVCVVLCGLGTYTHSICCVLGLSNAVEDDALEKLSVKRLDRYKVCKCFANTTLLTFKSEAKSRKNGSGIHKRGGR